jgi:hypothetical protein
MYRPVLILSFITMLLLAACEVRFLPYGEETPIVTSVDTFAGTEVTARATSTPEATAPARPISTPEPTPPTATTPVSTVETQLLPSVTPTTVLEDAELPSERAVEPGPLATVRRLYRVQAGSPTWLPNFIHPEAGCNWSGIAGQVFDANDLPVRSLVIEVGGTLQGVALQSLSLTGVATAYGPGGYEVVLGDRAFNSSSVLWLQIKDLSGKELSEPVFFDTFADCNRNLVLLNFIEASYEIEITEYFFPLFYNGFLGSQATMPLGRETQGEVDIKIYLPLFLNNSLNEIVEPPTP